MYIQHSQKMILTIVLLVTSLIIPTTLNAQDMKRSENWINVCQDNEKICLAWIDGVVDTWSFIDDVLAESQEIGTAKQQKRILKTRFLINNVMWSCLNSDVTNQQMVDVWMDYLDKTPQVHHLPPLDTLRSALRAAFPSDMEKYISTGKC